jgi:hypothetical protein
LHFSSPPPSPALLSLISLLHLLLLPETLSSVPQLISNLSFFDLPDHLLLLQALYLRSLIFSSSSSFYLELIEFLDYLLPPPLYLELSLSSLIISSILLLP